MIQITDNDILWANSLPYIDNKYRKNNWKHYLYQNSIGVPRVSNILETCISNQSLIKWAAGLGSIDEYNKVRYTALDTGSLVHEMIEDYLTEGFTKQSYKVSNFTNIEEANTSYNNYKSFESDLVRKGYTIDSLMLELECIGPLYGGTIDFVANINNTNTLESKLYILDFKTSKSISMQYLIQTMLYVLNINYMKSIGDPFYAMFDIGGIGIIRVDKYNNSKGYQYLLIDFDQDKEFAEQIANTAVEMVRYYYTIKNYEQAFKDNKKNLMDKGVIF